MTWRARLARWGHARLRLSMTAQIWLSITVMSTLLVAGSSLLVLRLSKQELGDVADVVLLSNLALLQQELGDDTEPLQPQAAADLVSRRELLLGNLHLALLDESRHLIAASEQFTLPLSALPAQVLDMARLPKRMTTEQLRRLQRQMGPLAGNWTGPDGKGFRFVLGRIALPVADPGAPATVLAVLALDAAPAMELTRQSVTVIAAALLLSGATAAVVGVWLARRIGVAARRLGTAAGRIDGRAQGERLDLAQLPIELRDAGEAFNRMLDRLEASYARLSEFSSDLAHDLRTPINNLLGEAQVALSRPRAAEEYRGVLESAVEDYERLSRLIENMLFLARAEDAQALVQHEWVVVQDLGTRVRDYFEALAEERQVRLVFTCHADAPATLRVWADRVMLARAVGNLLSNALRYAPAGSVVTLGVVVAADGAARLEVSNAGPAIPLQYQQKIFERLFRVDPAREGSAQGSGLGLAIVRSIMGLHGGRATVRSGNGPLTVFTLWFPKPVALAPPAALAEGVVPTAQA
jgi:two-component system heavy metal sensor histidine kinase CusS